ncbi:MULTISPECIES: hydroxymyristoyl-ACP dehydratase [Legionella]|uniref:(3R)-hydroxymyristoyl-ACP dehydratase n=1 Tax=Legionella drozanskii LLAP-1 TaxID=1212489 RepID=A0A0W0T8F7_9GAMM|nr:MULTISPECIES: hydroxymyristoyl-ACP dehydratase [Legionella]KTC91808.1 (3R)-hydroxymyristoyl-ACP dehydratase [Legionella drozanskii LLAP-1]PJE17976.1 MAG: hydroxymyristoyl-ACP dehydratase [Legionella sp.]
MGFLFVDRILQLLPGELARGVKHITHDDVYLCPDGQGRLCFIPSLIGETLGQLAAWNVMFSNDFTLRPVAGMAASARLHRPAYVGETLLLESIIESVDDKAVQYRSVAYVGDEVVFSLDGALGPLLPMTDFIDEQVVRRQFAEINRPGDWPQRSESEQLLSNSELISITSARPGLSMTFDRILNSDPGVSLTAEKYVTRAAPYFPDHFPHKPVLPMTVLLECKLNLAREFVARGAFKPNYQVSELRRIKMNEFVHPGDVLRSHLKVKEQNSEQLILNYRSEVDGRRVCVLDVVMMAKGN